MLRIITKNTITLSPVQSTLPKLKLIGDFKISRQATKGK